MKYYFCSFCGIVIKEISPLAVLGRNDIFFVGGAKWIPAFAGMTKS